MTDAMSAKARAASLTCWSGPVEPEPVAGDTTNINFQSNAPMRSWWTDSD